ncbi:hypothetical protein L1049_027038 [Liquidambar formosana]|uniref:Uncharacterized protein n=1 Tax=Liquidambar formosana TaxID=63359 RepID=A0AAP0NG09_LIQFO
MVFFRPVPRRAVRQNSDMDFDYMDALLSDGCWLETTDGSEFLLQSPSNSTALFDPSRPISQANNGNSCVCPSQKDTHEESQDQFSLGIHLPTNFMTEALLNLSLLARIQLMLLAVLVSRKTYLTEGSELGRRWWIGPRANPGSASSVMERIIRAMGYIKDSTKEKMCLFKFGCLNISVNYQFSAEKDSGETEGLPGRVFLGKVPEWTPDVRFFRSDEYPRLDYAQWYDVRGTLALPVFERGSRTCLGVIEVVTTTQKIKYRPELESVCKALEAVDLRSSEVVSTENVKASDKSYQAALPEILEVLKYACVTHRLPLAQTWIPCVQQGKGGCRHSDENYLHCVSTVDSACYVADPQIQGFHEACSEHHLLKGQGVPGRAFTTNQPCFSADITSFGKTEYPLSHHARMFGLHAAVAIRFRCVHTGAADFVLEFFLPVDCLDPEEQTQMLSSLSITIQQVCQSLRVVTDKELEEESVSPASEVMVPSDDGIEMLRAEHTHSERDTREESSFTACLAEVQQNGNVIPLLQKEKPREVQHQQDSSLKEGSVDSGDYSTFGGGNFSSAGKTGEKRRAKAEKTITLKVLQQYFAGSLKDAANSLGVCPTTLKRICRQYGINRWPSRKIKKVGHSLEKIQRVIDSVQGASGSLQIGSFCSNFSEMASPSLPGTSTFSTSKPSDHQNPLSMQPEGGIFSPPTGSSSPSSGSQSSSSTQSCSSGKLLHSSTSIVAGCKDAVVGENPDDGVLERVRNETQLHASSLEEPKLLPKSERHKSLSKDLNFESLPPLPKGSGRISREGDGKRIKVTYGEEKVRFRMQNNCGFEDLRKQIAQRFDIDDTSEFHLKYLDDESEWVLLTCDADLEECIDVCGSSTIKLALQVSHRR